MNRPFTAAAIAMALTAVPASYAFAADHQVMMLNKDSEGRAMQFEPAFLKVAPGDTVTFVPTDKTHNAEAIAKQLPEGAKPWKGKINEELTVTFDVVGFHPYKCLPHAGMGMVGLIQVGEAGAPDPALAKAVPGKGKARMQELVEQAGEQ